MFPPELLEKLSGRWMLDRLNMLSKKYKVSSVMLLAYRTGLIKHIDPRLVYNACAEENFSSKFCDKLYRRSSDTSIAEVFVELHMPYVRFAGTGYPLVVTVRTNPESALKFFYKYYTHNPVTITLNVHDINGRRIDVRRVFVPVALYYELNNDPIFYKMVYGDSAEELFNKFDSVIDSIVATVAKLAELVDASALLGGEYLPTESLIDTYFSESEHVNNATQCSVASGNAVVCNALHSAVRRGVLA